MWKFKELLDGPRWHVIKSGLPSFSAAEAFAADYFQANGDMQMVDADIDRVSLVADFMVAQCGCLRQFAIDPA